MFSFIIHDIKKFMNLLLLTPTFNEFTFCQGEIHSHATFTIHGKKDKDYMGEDVAEEDFEPYCYWSEIQAFVFESVKGVKLPKLMKLVLSLPQKSIEHYPNTKSVSMNLLFRDGKLMCTLSSMPDSFDFQKNSQEEWINYITTFLKENDIAIEAENI